MTTSMRGMLYRSGGAAEIKSLIIEVAHLANRGAEVRASDRHTE